MKKYIHIQKGDREFIAKAFGVTARTVFNATHFEDMNEGNDLAKKIRTMARKRGGIVMTVSPEMETLHDADGYMRQYFGNGAVVELSKTDGSGAVLFKGEEVKKYENVMVTDIEGIQRYAAGLS